MEGERARFLRSVDLPLEKDACSACIRHFYQNELMNSLWKVYEKGKLYGVAEDVIHKAGDTQIEPFWV